MNISVAAVAVEFMELQTVTVMAQLGQVEWVVEAMAQAHLVPTGMAQLPSRF